MRNCQNGFHSGCTILHSYQQCIRILLTHYFPSFIFLMIALLMGVMWYLIVVLICISIVTNGGRRQWHRTPVLLPGKSHGWRSLVGCSPWGRWVGHNWATSLSLSTFMHWRRKWQPTPVFLPGESHGRRSLVGGSPWGRTESDTTEATQQQQWLMVLSIFSFAYWLFVSLLWWKVCSGALLLSISLSVFCYWLVGVIYIF